MDTNTQRLGSTLLRYNNTIVFLLIIGHLYHDTPIVIRLSFDSVDHLLHTVGVPQLRLRRMILKIISQ